MDYEYILTSEGKLMHTQRLAYVDLDEGELAHFKYIKREKLPNGKWRYYYDAEQMKTDFKDSTGITARNKYKEAEKTLDTSKKALSETLKYRDTIEKSYANRTEEYANAGVDPNKLNEAARKAAVAKQALDKYRLDSKHNPFDAANTYKHVGLTLTYNALDKKLKDLQEKDASLKKQAKDNLDLVTDTTKKYLAAERQNIQARYEAGKAYAEAQKEYYKTPLGKLESAVNNGVTWLTSFFTKRKKT